MNSRRILIVLIGVLVLALVGIGAYFLITRITDSSEDTSGSLPEIGGDFASVEPGTSDLATAKIPLDPATAYHAFPDGSVIAVHRNGMISRVSSSTVTALSSSAVPNFASAAFSADGSKILVLTGQQPRSQANVFDVATASWRVIPGTFRDAVWGPSGTTLATLTPDAATGKTAVSIYDTATGKTTQTLATLALGDVSIAWPARNTVVVSDKPTARSTGSAWAIDIPTKRISLAARGTQGFTAIWAPDGTTGIAFQSNRLGMGGSLSMVANGVQRAKLAFTSIPEKCAFTSLIGSSTSTPYVICAVPRDQEAFQRLELPDTWYRKQVYTDDILIGVNLITDDVDFTISPPTTVDATRLQVVGTTVYYADRATDLLYKSEI